jgi:hypothetical protein
MIERFCDATVLQPLLTDSDFSLNHEDQSNSPMQHAVFVRVYFILFDFSH